jgi:hypothetical protein
MKIKNHTLISCKTNNKNQDDTSIEISVTSTVSSVKPKRVVDSRIKKTTLLIL